MAPAEATPRFVADAMLGRLAKSMRILGYDVSYDPASDDASLKLAAVRDQRIILTRDREVAETGLPVRVVLVSSDHHKEQLRQVVSEFGLPAPEARFTRCLVCNLPVEDVPKAEVEGAVPPYVLETQDSFARCRRCGRVYWNATHVAHAVEWLDEVLGAADRPHPAGGESAPDLDAQASAEDAPRALEKNVFVTGRPGVGKTTLIRRVLETLGPEAGGFYTHEIREGGRRVGFAVRDVRGPEGILAHVDLESPYRVGRYGVNREDLERIGVAAILDAVRLSRLVVMDEIGRMELCSPAFQDAVRTALDSPRPVLGVLQDRHNPFLDAVRSRADVRVLRITEANRDAMVGTVLESVRRLVEGGGS